MYAGIRTYTDRGHIEVGTLSMDGHAQRDKERDKYPRDENYSIGNEDIRMLVIPQDNDESVHGNCLCSEP